MRKKEKKEREAKETSCVFVLSPRSIFFANYDSVFFPFFPLLSKGLQKKKRWKEKTKRRRREREKKTKRNKREREKVRNKKERKPFRLNRNSGWNKRWNKSTSSSSSSFHSLFLSIPSIPKGWTMEEGWKKEKKEREKKRETWNKVISHSICNYWKKKKKILLPFLISVILWRWSNYESCVSERMEKEREEERRKRRERNVHSFILRR